MKTGFRWHMNKSLRRHLKKVPYFLLFNYPKKLEAYNKAKSLMKLKGEDTTGKLNAFMSPAPLNELAIYVDRWEQTNFVRFSEEHYHNTYNLLINKAIPVDNPVTLKKVAKLNRTFNREMRIINKMIDDDKSAIDLLEDLYKQYEDEFNSISTDRQVVANYLIEACYQNKSTPKNLCWKLYGDILVNNIKNNSGKEKRTKIIETSYVIDGTYEFLGKHYIMIDEHNI